VEQKEEIFPRKELKELKEEKIEELKKNKMAKQIGEDTKVTLDLKTIGMIVAFVITLAGMWFTLQADIAQAKELPAPVIDRVEYDLKDELIRQTIMDTQEDVEEIKETIDKIDERLYEIQKSGR
jgi:hypothetical protein